MSQKCIDAGRRSFQSVSDLEKLVVRLSEQYNRAEDCTDFDAVAVADADYDEMHRILKQKNPNSQAFSGTTPGDDKITTGNIVIHDPPMTSIDKANGEEKLQKYEGWLANCARDLDVDEVEIAQSWKHDGCAVRFNYVKGRFVSAGNRPRNGIDGADITGHAKYVKGVPMNLRLPLTLSLNGEIECKNLNFEKINAARKSAGEDLYENSRNYTAGRLNKEDPDEIKGSLLTVSFLSITGFDEWQDYYKTEIERAIWANAKDGLGLGNFIQVRIHDFDDLEIMEKQAPDLDYEVDGVVLKVNDLEWQEQLGHHGDDPIKEPRGALAWKFKEETAEAVVDHIEWNASRTGRIVPKVIFEKSVRLASTSVSMATCNNYGWVKDRKIGVGTVLEIQKAGKIIPNVVRVVSNSVAKFEALSNCPVCNSKLRVHTSDSGNRDLMCKNSNCGAKQIKSWVFYFQNLGGKGLGESAMEKILAKDRGFCLPDFYKLTVKDLLSFGFSARQALLALATIWMIKPSKDDDKLIIDVIVAKNKKQKVQAWKFFAALGIPGAGKTAGKILIDHFKDFDSIIEADVDELQSIDGIGDVTAEAILDYFEENDWMVRELLDNYIEVELPKIGKLTGKNFVFTGSFTDGKKHWQALIEDQGGKIQSSVGAKTNYLVQQHGKSDGSPSKKEEAAVKHSTEIISVKDLQKLL